MPNWGYEPQTSRGRGSEVHVRKQGWIIERRMYKPGVALCGQTKEMGRDV